MSERIGLNRVHFPVTALGPGRRIGIWLQGCSIRCPGCMSLDTWAPAETTIAVSEVFDRISAWFPVADGVTISGGEPFDQPQALLALLTELRTAQRGSILVYSGYSLGILTERHLEVLAQIDVLISEPFDAACSEPVLLRGSSNQRVTCLTGRGLEMWRAAVTSGDQAARIDIVVGDDGELWLAGIPRPGDLDRLSRALGGRGITGKTSAGRLRGTS
jgi:anaerobic ribonucleoside-triphosphate reductase activating protein